MTKSIHYLQSSHLRASCIPRARLHLNQMQLTHTASQSVLSRSQVARPCKSTRFVVRASGQASFRTSHSCYDRSRISLLKPALQAAPIRPRCYSAVYMHALHTSSLVVCSALSRAQQQLPLQPFLLPSAVSATAEPCQSLRPRSCRLDMFIRAGPAVANVVPQKVRRQWECLSMQTFCQWTTLGKAGYTCAPDSQS